MCEPTIEGWIDIDAVQDVVDVSTSNCDPVKMIEPIETLAARVRAGSVVRLDDPAREEILAEIQGRLPKTNRLNNSAQPTTIDGHIFPSKKEAGRYVELKLAERAGYVSYLQIQVLFPLVVNGVAIFPRGYLADFVYIEHRRNGFIKLIVEDCKGVRTDTYIVKRQLVLAIWGITILET